MKTLIFSLCVFFSFSNLLAQNSNFRVLLTEGTNTVGQNQFITVGMEIPENQTINFQGEYLALADSKGKTVEITEKGIYKTKKLLKKCKSGKVIKTKYPLYKILIELDSREPFKPITRCRCSSPIRLLGNHKTYLYQKDIRVDWYYKTSTARSASKIEKYLIHITNIEGTVIKEIETQATFYNFSSEIFEKEEMLIFKVMVWSKNEIINPEEDGHAIFILDKTTKNQITKDLQKIQNPEAPILSQLVLANYFEEKELLIDARLAYIKLLEMKDLAIFRTLYQNFLYRNRLTKEAYLEEDKGNRGND